MQAVPSQLGPYRLVRLLGEGGMGSVYEAVHLAIERQVAIKILKPDYARDDEILARFFNEARAVNRISHPGIVQVSDVHQTPEGLVYLVMELMRGETLEQRITRIEAGGQRMPVDSVLHLAWQVADALSATHDKGIVHRDLKTDNIMLVPDSAVAQGERAKVLDFGIAKLLQASQKLTMRPRAMGTVLYMSPEQCRGIQDIDGRTDVYALGVILYRVLAGRLPFEGDRFEAVMGQHFFLPPPDLAPLAPHAVPGLVELVHRMLIKERTLRPDMHQTVASLEELLPERRSRPAEPIPELRFLPVFEPANVTEAPTTPDPRPAETLAAPRRRVTLVAAAVAMLLLLGGGIWFGLTSYRILPTSTAVKGALAAAPESPAAAPAPQKTELVPAVPEAPAKAVPELPRVETPKAEPLPRTPTPQVEPDSPEKSPPSAPSNKPTAQSAASGSPSRPVKPSKNNSPSAPPAKKPAATGSQKTEESKWY